MPKPFDLEAAKRGEPMQDYDGNVARFVGTKRDGGVVVELDGGGVSIRLQESLLMSDESRRFYLNARIAGPVDAFDSEDRARDEAYENSLVIALGIEIAADGTASIFQQGKKR